MPDSAQARVTAIARDARRACRELKRLSRPSAEFDARRYFRGDAGLGFYNVGTSTVRQLARSIVHDKGGGWVIEDARGFAEVLIRNPYLEAKGLGIEVLARYRRFFTPALLPVWKRWLKQNHAANWATTDAMCGLLIGPLLRMEPSLVNRMALWARDKNLWVRRAAAVSLIPSVRHGQGVDAAYQIARSLHGDRADLIQKAVGWLLREAGKVDSVRLERYLRAHGPTIPRTTVRYAIERFDETSRRDLLHATLPRTGDGARRGRGGA